MKLYKYTESELRRACSQSGSMRQVLIKLNVVPAGGNYNTLRKAIKHFNIDIEHFHGQGWNKGDHSGLLKKARKSLSLNEVLQDGVDYQSYKLKRRLIDAGLKQHKCEQCGLTEWNGLKVPIELDHVNGKRDDNRLKNLRILCPNCHAQTKTYRGKNIKKTS